MSDDGSVPADDAVSQLCITCGYDLRGQSMDDNCPECGTPVERSMRGDRLQYADPGWLKQIARGQKFFMWGVWLVAAYIPIFIIAILLIGLVLSGVVPDSLEDLPIYGAFASLIIGFMLGAIGAFLLTKPEPRSADREPELSSNRIARVAALLALITLAVHIFLGESGVVRLPGILHRIGFFAVAVFVTIACAAIFKRFAAFARRIPDADLEKRMQRHFKNVVWSVPLLFLAQLFNSPPMAAAPGPDWLAMVTGIVTLVAGCAVLVLLVGLCRTLQLFRRRLQQCVEQNESAQHRGQF